MGYVEIGDDGGLGWAWMVARSPLWNVNLAAGRRDIRSMAKANDGFACLWRYGRRGFSRMAAVRTIGVMPSPGVNEPGERAWAFVPIFRRTMGSFAALRV